MISNILEGLGFGFLTLAAYELSGRVAAFAVLGMGFLFIGFVLDGVKMRLPASWKKREPEKRKAKLAEKPLTNEDFVRLLAATQPEE